MKSLNSFSINVVKRTATENPGVSPRLLVGTDKLQDNKLNKSLSLEIALFCVVISIKAP